MKSKFAAQLYTLRDLLQEDFPKVLRDLKAMGWEAVQIDGLYGHSAEEIAEVLEGTGLKVAGMHVSFERLEDELDALIHEAKTFNTPYIICPYLEEERQTVEGYKHVKKTLLEISKKVASEGIKIGYHNEDVEFLTEVNGQTAIEYLLQPEGEDSLFAEIDTYWVKSVGHDPLEFIQKYAGRMPILHLKDMTNDERRYFAEIGTGSIDFEPILKWGEENGVEYYAIEQDYCPGNPLDSLKISLDNLIELSKRI